MKKRDFHLIIIILFMAISALVLGRLTLQGYSNSTEAVIYQKDEEYLRISLNNPQTVVVEENGRLNKIAITENGFSMLESNCHNQYCLHQGEVTLDNMDQRLFGAWIYCLPNEVSIELVKGE